MMIALTGISLYIIFFSCELCAVSADLLRVIDNTQCYSFTVTLLCLQSFMHYL